MWYPLAPQLRQPQAQPSLVSADLEVTYDSNPNNDDGGSAWTGSRIRAPQWLEPHIQYGTVQYSTPNRDLNHVSAQGWCVVRTQFLFGFRFTLPPQLKLCRVSRFWGIPYVLEVQYLSYATSTEIREHIQERCKRSAWTRRLYMTLYSGRRSSTSSGHSIRGRKYVPRVRVVREYRETCPWPVADLMNCEGMSGAIECNIVEPREAESLGEPLQCRHFTFSALDLLARTNCHATYDCSAHTSESDMGDGIGHYDTHTPDVL